MAVDPKLSFEQAFRRLEEILEHMNASTITLEESLSLFEEANELIVLTQQKLAEAEKRVEVLVKNRQGDLVSAPNGQIQTTPLE